MQTSNDISRAPFGYRCLPPSLPSLAFQNILPKIQNDLVTKPIFNIERFAAVISFIAPAISYLRFILSCVAKQEVVINAINSKHYFAIARIRFLFALVTFLLFGENFRSK